MQVKIKSFDVQMEIKNKGVELDISDGKGRLGDLVVTRTGLIWCKGKVSREKGVKISWKEFIEWMESE
ncbi:MAG: hypothetical protein H5U33_25480 [Pseudomonas sp.]|nr:hypothetical protein [Pseudomonas sp.]